MADQYFATGRRKKSVARVELIPGTGAVTINGKKYRRIFWSGDAEADRASAAGHYRYGGKA